MGETVKMSDSLDIKEVRNGAMHLITNKIITKYKKLLSHPLLRDVWLKAIRVKLGSLAQRYGNIKGANTLKSMTLEEIKEITKDIVVTYTRRVLDYRPQKEDKNWVRLIVEENSINYP